MFYTIHITLSFHDKTTDIREPRMKEFKKFILFRGVVGKNTRMKYLTHTDKHTDKNKDRET